MGLILQSHGSEKMILFMKSIYKMQKLIVIIFLIFFSFKVFAVEVLDVCATYSNSGKKYKVEGQILKGAELNQRTDSYDYNSYSTYVVIFWTNAQATIIELDYYFESLGFMGSDGKDQGGKPWKVEEGHLYCY